MILCGVGDFWVGYGQPVKSPKNEMARGTRVFSRRGTWWWVSYLGGVRPWPLLFEQPVLSSQLGDYEAYIQSLHTARHDILVGCRYSRGNPNAGVSAGVSVGLLHHDRDDFSQTASSQAQVRRHPDRHLGHGFLLHHDGRR